MVITINTTNLINDISGMFLQEIPTEVHIPPTGVIVQALNEATARLRIAIGRYLEPDYKDSATDELSIPESYEFKFALSPRKSSGKAQAAADLVHSYLVNVATAKCMSNSLMVELGGKHDQQGIADLQNLLSLLTTKLPPQL